MKSNMTLKERINQKIVEISTTTENMHNEGKSEEEIQKFASKEMEKLAQELQEKESINIEEEIKKELQDKGIKSKGNMIADFFLYMMID